MCFNGLSLGLYVLIGRSHHFLQYSKQHSGPSIHLLGAFHELHEVVPDPYG
jgi:hypothetical protein